MQIKRQMAGTTHGNCQTGTSINYNADVRKCKPKLYHANVLRQRSEEIQDYTKYTKTRFVGPNSRI